MTTLAVYQQSSATIMALHGSVSLTFSREADRLSDPVKGEPPIEVSGSHLSSATTLTVAPQTTFSFRGSVLAGATFTIAGHATTYTTTAKAEVDETSPDTLDLLITPGLEAPLVGAEVVTLTEQANVTYTAREETDKAAVSRGWDVVPKSAMFVVLHTTERAPLPGDIVSGAVAGSILMVDTFPQVNSVIQVGLS